MGTQKTINRNTDEPKRSVSLLILNLTGLAFGMGAIEPTEETNPLSGFWHRGR